MIHTGTRYFDRFDLTDVSHDLTSFEDRDSPLACFL